MGWYENKSEIFLAMEYIQYGDLSEYMKDQQTARAEAGEVTRQILEGLKILHGEAICHRDLKPQVWLLESKQESYTETKKMSVEYPRCFARPTLGQSCRFWNLETNK